MKLYDRYTEKVYSLPELFKQWQCFRLAEPGNHAETFSAELFEILMATINGRNDCDVVGLVPAELSRYIIRIRSGLEEESNV